MNAVEALPLAGGVPGGVQEEQVVGSRQVEANTPGLDIDIKCDVDS